MSDSTSADDVYEAPHTIRAMMFGVGSLLWALTPEQRALAEYPMADRRRLDWDFVPKPDRIGLPLSVMNQHQRSLAHTLLASALSLRGYTQVLQIMAMENVLRELQVKFMGLGAAQLRNPDHYYFSFFGRPAFEETWGWRVLGHHLSLSYTIVDERYLIVTPCNMGAEPAEAGLLSPLRRDDELGFQLLAELPHQQRLSAIVHDVAPADFVTRQVAEVGEIEYPDHYDLGLPEYVITEEDRQKLRFVRDEPAGICAAAMPTAQADTLLELVDCYLGRMPDELRDRHRDRLAAGGLDQLHFAWAGGERPGTPHYYRIHGRDLLIEFDNAIGQGNHIHSVWRDLRNDLGGDLLLDHYERERATGSHLATRLTSSVPARNRRSVQGPLASG